VYNYKDNSKRCGSDNIAHGRENIDRCGEIICDLENFLKLIQRHVTRSRPITFRILTLVCNTECKQLNKFTIYSSQIINYSHSGHSMPAVEDYKYCLLE